MWIRLPSHIMGDLGKWPAFLCPPCSGLHVDTETQERNNVTWERDSFSQVPSRKAEQERPGTMNRCAQPEREHRSCGRLTCPR